MLRVHLMPNWFGLSGPAMEEALYEITPMRTFATRSTAILFTSPGLRSRN